MSVVARFSAPGTTTEQYDEVIRRLEGTGGFPPDGLEYHVCFPADGDVRVSEIWDSLEQFQAFGERLMPLLAEVGIDPGQPEMFEIYNIVRRSIFAAPGEAKAVASGAGMFGAMAAFAENPEIARRIRACMRPRLPVVRLEMQGGAAAAAAAVPGHHSGPDIPPLAG